MKILAFETATAACSAALLVNGEICEEFIVAPQRHAELILPMIEKLLARAGVSLRDLNAIAVGRGPGSFMGVRIAVGIAQGLAFGADLPVIPLSTLQILAQTAHLQTGSAEIIAGWDARMQAIYWGAYRLTDQGVMAPVIADALSAPHDIIIPLPEKQWLLAGNAWAIYRQELGAVLGSKTEALDIYPRAGAMLGIAARLYQENQVQKAWEIEPVYLRDQVVQSDREKKYDERQTKNI